MKKPILISIISIFIAVCSLSTNVYFALANASLQKELSDKAQLVDLAQKIRPIYDEIYQVLRTGSENEIRATGQQAYSIYLSYRSFLDNDSTKYLNRVWTDGNKADATEDDKIALARFPISLFSVAINNLESN